MKKIKKIGLITGLIIMIFGCEELPDPAGERGIAVVPGISDINPGIFDSKNLNDTYVQFVVSVPQGQSVSKITVQGSYQENYERVAIDEYTSFPATVRIDCSEAAQKLGVSLAEIENGDVFVFELLTQAGDKASRSPAFLRIPVACAYDVNLATGSYNAVSDWPSDYDVTIAADPQDPYKILITGLGALDGAVEDNGPFVIHIDPATYEVTCETKTITSDYYGFGAITYSGEGVFSSCNGSYKLYIDISVGAYGSQGIYTYDLTRK